LEIKLEEKILALIKLNPIRSYIDINNTIDKTNKKY
jgi:hypothetical protein